MCTYIKRSSHTDNLNSVESPLTFVNLFPAIQYNKRMTSIDIIRYKQYSKTRSFELELTLFTLDNVRTSIGHKSI